MSVEPDLQAHAASVLSATDIPTSKLVATWIRDEKLDTLVPNEPKITSG